MMAILKMIKKIFLTLIITFAFCFNACNASALKITDLVVDNSEALIVLPSDNNGNKSISVSSNRLDNPQRTYFDIKDAILTTSSIEYFLKSSNISQIKIAQNSTDPKIVRLTIYHNDKFDPSKIQLLKMKNALVFRIKEPKTNQNFLKLIFRESFHTNSDYLENLNFLKTSSNSNSQQQTTSGALTQEDLNKLFIGKSNLKLGTQNFINKVSIKNGNMLLNGLGTFTSQKPLVLYNPTRVVFDFPNSLLNNVYNNQTFKISETEKMQISQFEPSKVRVCVHTEKPEKYIPVFSFDNQSMLIANTDRISSIKLFDKKSKLESFKIKKVSFEQENLEFEFNNPAIFGINTLGGYFSLYLYNTYFEDLNKIKNTIKNSCFSNASVQFLSNSIIKISIPKSSSGYVRILNSQDGQNLVLQIFNPNKKIDSVEAPKTMTPPKATEEFSPEHLQPNVKVNKKLIVLDAGHGGTETGAIRAGILEKDMTIDVTKKVAKILSQKGYEIVMTRNDDETVSLQKRVEISNEKNPAVFMSIHINASVSESARGVETHYYKDNSLEFAKIVQSKLAKLNSPDRGVHKSRFYVINHTIAPAVLVEIGFISNTQERNDMLSEERKQQTAKLLAEAILEYLK